MPTTMPPNSPIAAPQSCRAIVFQIAGHWLALPPTAVLRVVNKATLNDYPGSQTLVYLGNQPLPVVDLHPVLAAVQGDHQPQRADTDGQFLIIVAVGKTLVAISSDQSPTLIELPLATTHPVPPPYYHAIHGIASHMAVVPQLGTVFLLNLCRIQR